jgi:hypothetical protein
MLMYTGVLDGIGGCLYAAQITEASQQGTGLTLLGSPRVPSAKDKCSASRCVIRPFMSYYTLYQKLTDVEQLLAPRISSPALPTDSGQKTSAATFPSCRHPAVCKPASSQHGALTSGHCCTAADCNQGGDAPACKTALATAAEDVAGVSLHIVPSRPRPSCIHV